MKRAKPVQRALVRKSCICAKQIQPMENPTWSNAYTIGVGVTGGILAATTLLYVFNRIFPPTPPVGS